MLLLPAADGGERRCRRAALHCVCARGAAALSLAFSTTERALRTAYSAAMTSSSLASEVGLASEVAGRRPVVIL